MVNDAETVAAVAVEAALAAAAVVDAVGGEAVVRCLSTCLTDEAIPAAAVVAGVGSEDWGTRHRSHRRAPYLRSSCWNS